MEMSHRNTAVIVFHGDKNYQSLFYIPSEDLKNVYKYESL